LLARIKWQRKLFVISSSASDALKGDWHPLRRVEDFKLG
jgi:hypothetical protein